MNVGTDGERFFLETDPSDADLARSLSDLARDGIEVGRQLGLVDDTDAETGECFNCGDTARLRQNVLHDDQGRMFTEGLCAGCQRDLVERGLEQARANAEADDGGDS